MIENKDWKSIQAQLKVLLKRDSQTIRMIQTMCPYICTDECRDLFFRHDRIFNN